MMTVNCTSNGQPVSLARLRFGSFLRPETVEEIDVIETRPSVIRARLMALNGLIRSDVIKRSFLSSGGMDEILNLLLQKDEALEGAQVKAANLVKDNFLDEAMGASLGVWPVSQLKWSADEECKEDARTSASDGCWAYHIGQVAERNKPDDSHWSVELLKMLRESSAGGGGSHDTPGKEEL